MGRAALAVSETFFFYGRLGHAPLLRMILGHQPAMRPALLGGHRVLRAAAGNFPALVRDPGATAPGVLVDGLTPDDRARLDFYGGACAFRTQTLDVQPAGAGAPLAAQVYVSEAVAAVPASDWVLADWAAQWGEVVTATAADEMALYGAKPAAAVAARHHMMLVRGASRVRAAAAPAPATLRRAVAADDVQVAARREPYAHFFAVEEWDVAFRRFGGGMAGPVERAAFVTGDAVVVLPYDPVRDRVMLVEQFRVGAFARGDRNPWSLEGIAGRIDPGETPEVAGRREAAEEAGLTFGDLLPVGNFYPSPGAKTEFLYTYVALADLPDSAAGLGGLADEAEDIRAHVIAFDRMMDLVASGEINNGPLILLALWLQRERGRLRTG